MSAQRLSPKNVTKIAQHTGLDVLMAWAHGGYDFEFVTADHRHGLFNKVSKEWRFYTEDDYFLHYSPFCQVHWPE